MVGQQVRGRGEYRCELGMQLLYKIEDLALVPGPVYLAIGVFDGIHIGHQAVIGGAVRSARQSSAGRAVVITFDPHPIRVLRPEKTPRILMTPANKRRAVEELGVDAMLTISFTREFSSLSAEDFVQRLFQSANSLREIWVGEGWRFGANRAGGMSLWRVALAGGAPQASVIRSSSTTSASRRTSGTWGRTSR